MPIEIRELHIKAVVGTSTPNRPGPPVRDEDQQDQESLVAQCVERVMQILARQKER
jgi:hypothetical protein